MRDHDEMSVRTSSSRHPPNLLPIEGGAGHPASKWSGGMLALKGKHVVATATWHGLGLDELECLAGMLRLRGEHGALGGIVGFDDPTNGF